MNSRNRGFLDRRSRGRWGTGGLRNLMRGRRLPPPVNPKPVGGDPAGWLCFKDRVDIPGDRLHGTPPSVLRVRNPVPKLPPPPGETRAIADCRDEGMPCPQGKHRDWHYTNTPSQERKPRSPVSGMLVREQREPRLPSDSVCFERLRTCPAFKNRMPSGGGGGLHQIAERGRAERPVGARELLRRHVRRQLRRETREQFEVPGARSPARHAHPGDAAAPPHATPCGRNPRPTCPRS